MVITPYTIIIIPNLTENAKCRLLALMGPSGSGKTTLLNALAGQVPASSRLTLWGRIHVNGTPQQQSSHAQGYVQQEDVFFSQLTVRYTLVYARRR